MNAATESTAKPAVARVSSWLLLGSIADSVIGYAFWAVAARTTSAATLGSAAALIALVAAICRFTGAGAGLSLIQWSMRPEVGQRSSISASIAGASIAAVLAGVAAVTALPHISAGYAALRAVAAAAAVIGATAIWQCHVLLDQAFVAVDRPRAVTIRSVAFSAGKLAALLAMAVAGVPLLTAIMVSWYGAAGAVALVSFAVLARTLPPTPDEARTRSSLLGMARSAARHHASVLPSIMAAGAVPVIMAANSSPTDFAYFSLAWMIANAILLTHSAGSLALYSEATRNPTAPSMRSAARSAYRFVGTITAGVLLLTGAMYPVLHILGREYASHVYPLVLLFAAAAIPATVTQLATATWRAQQRLRLVTIFNASTSTATVALVLVLIPTTHIYAVAWAQLGVRHVGVAVVVLIQHGRRLVPRHGRRVPG